MFDLATPPASDAVVRLLSENGLKEGMCLVVAVDRDEGGFHVLGASHTTDTCASAIELAGSLSPTHDGVLVVARCGGRPLVVVRYGDTPQDLD